MTSCGDIAVISLSMRISAIFLLPVEVLLTDSESHKPIFNSGYGSIWLSFRDLGMGQTNDRRQTPDIRRQTNQSIAYC